MTLCQKVLHISRTLECENQLSRIKFVFIKKDVFVCARTFAVITEQDIQRFLRFFYIQSFQD